MSKKIPFPSSTRHLLLYDEDWEYLESRFGPRGVRPVGVSTVIRAILHQKVMALRQAEVEARDQQTPARDPPRPTHVSGAAHSVHLTEDLPDV